MKTRQTNLMAIQGRHLKQEILVLRELQVPAVHIARLLRENPATIRQNDKRARERGLACVPLPPDPTAPSVAPLEVPSSPRDARRRSPPSEPSHPWIQDQRKQFSECSAEELEDLRSRNIPKRRSSDVTELMKLLRTLVEVRADARSFHLLEGYVSLKREVPSVAKARHGWALNRQIWLYEELARFALLMGNLDDAFEYALDDLKNAKSLVKGLLGRTDFVKRYGDAAYLASATLQNQRRFSEALPYAQESFWAWCPLGWQRPNRRRSRQFGATLLRFSAGRSGKSLSEFIVAMEELRLNRKSSNRAIPADPWNEARNQLPIVLTNFGRGSIQHVIAVNWLAARGILAGRSSEALELLRTIDPDPNEMRYQAKFTKLLQITPELELKPFQLEFWINFLSCDLSFHEPNPQPEAA